MNPQGMDLLAQLRDIHGAPQAPVWPPAPGWWLLALLGALAFFFLFRYAIGRYRARQRRQRLNRFLDRVVSEVDPSRAPQEYLSSLNRIFKIVALRAFPDHRCAFLQGREWVKFLQARLDGADGSEALAVLADGPYQPQPQIDAGAMASLARRWVNRYG